jgi:uncharacterized surface anchored protein
MKRWSLVAAVVALVSSAAFAVDTDPIPGADVKVGKKPPGGGVIVAQGTTDAQGRFSFENLKPGTYFVRFTVADRSYEVAANPAGGKLRIAKPAAAEAGSVDSRQALVAETFTVDYEEVAVTLEILGSSIRGSINKARSNIKNVR